MPDVAALPGLPSASRRGTRSAAEFAWTVPEPPSCPVLKAVNRSTTSAPRTSPTTRRSGRMRRVCRTRSCIVTAPALSMFGGRVWSRTTCGCWGASSRVSSTITIRSSGPTTPSNALRRVVLPDPVPPVTRKVRRRCDELPKGRLQLSSDHSLRDQVAQRPRSVPRDPQHHADAVGQGRQHRVQPNAVGKRSVDERCGVIEPTTHRAGQTLGQAPNCEVIGEPDRGELHALTVVGPHLGCAVDGDVGDRRVGEQRLKRTITLEDRPTREDVSRLRPRSSTTCPVACTTSRTDATSTGRASSSSERRTSAEMLTVRPPPEPARR